MDPTDSLDQWLNKLLGVEKFKPGLERLIPIFEKYRKEFTQRNIKVITIGGTNGKGECSLSLDFLLRKEGKYTALWTSPHIKSVTERFSFNGINVEAKKLLDIFERNKTLVPQLSYYEYLFKCFCDLVLDNSQVEIIILEVGLGGRLDTVNLFDADIAAITSIGLDHQEYLGPTLKDILREKLGIIRKGNPLFCNLKRKFLIDQAKLRCSEEDAEFTNLMTDETYDLQDKDYSFQNKSLAIAIKNYVLNKKFSAELFRDDLRELSVLKLKGRMETVNLGQTEVICNGAHNIDGMRKMRDKLVADKDFFDTVIFAPSSRKDTEIKALIKVLKSAKCLYNRLVITTFENHPRSLTKDQLKDIEGELELVDWQKELETCKDKRNKVLLTGSYYFIGEFQKAFNI